MSSDKQHLPWLDLIRFTAAFLVVICHVRCEMLQTYSMLQPDSQNIFTQMLYFATGMGKAGVLIFFILSGFLVGGKNLSRALAGSISLKNYIIDRAIRIGVPLLCSLLLVCLVDYIQLQFEIDNTGMSYGLIAQHNTVEILGNIFGLQGVLVGDAGGVFWTLAYEIWFYVLIGGILAVMLKTRRDSVRYIGWGIICLALLVFSFLHFVWLTILISGIMAYYFSKKQISKRVFYTALVAFLCVIIVMPLTSETHTSRFVLKVPSEVFVVMTGLFGAIVIGGLVQYTPKGRITNCINNMGTFLASFSYSLYLTHYQVIRLMRTIGIEQYDYISIKTIAIFICEVVACMLFAYLFYTITEKQTTKIKDYIKLHV